MKQYVATKDDSIGGILLDNGKVLIAKKVNGRKVVEIIEQTSDIIEKVLPIAKKIIAAIQDFLNSIFFRFPCVIVQDKKTYVFTMQPAPFKAIDRVFYMNELDRNDIIYLCEDERMVSAKASLRNTLKGLGYIG